MKLGGNWSTYQVEMTTIITTEGIQMTKEYICKYCEQIFSNHNKYAAHVGVHKRNEKTEIHTCSICGKKFDLKSSLTMHERFCKKSENTESKLKFNDFYICYCKYCGKECKSLNSLKQHEIRCSKNPSKILPSHKINGAANKGRIPWNKGLTKESDSRVKKTGESISKSTKGRLGHSQSATTKQKLRELALERELGGFNFRRGVTYNNIKLDSSYEVKVAESLDKNNIRWQRCSRFKYIDNNGKLHHYTPDFYLPDYNVYLDPKNDYLINNIKKGWEFSDKTKIEWVMEQNNIVILILDKNNLSWDKIKDKIYQEIKIN